MEAERMLTLFDSLAFLAGLLACCGLAVLIMGSFLHVLLDPPDFNVGHHMKRWYIIPRNRRFNIYVHRIYADDDDRGLHDHPWFWNISIPLGSYIERVPASPIGNHRADRPERTIVRRPLFPIVRVGVAPHRITLINHRPVWSIFITGSVVRTWGFYLPGGWISHNDLARDDRYRERIGGDWHGQEDKSDASK